jgi:hypothetical protein
MRLDDSSLSFPPNQPPRPSKSVSFVEEQEECETWHREDYARGWTVAEKNEMQETALKRAAAEAKIIADENALLPEHDAVWRGVEFERLLGTVAMFFTTRLCTLMIFL